MINSMRGGGSFRDSAGLAIRETVPRLSPPVKETPARGYRAGMSAETQSGVCGNTAKGV